MQVNEVSRMVIVVPGGEDTFVRERNYVGVALDHGDDGLAVSSLMDVPSWAYAIIGRACDGRAVDTVGGDLVVNGKMVTPEKYIGLWRDALADPLSPQEAHDRFGVTVKLVARGNALKQKGLAKKLTTDPMEGFDDWLARFKDAIQPDQDGYFELELDMREDGAYVAWTHLQSYTDYRDKDPRARGLMRVHWSPQQKSELAQDDQSSLFA